VFSCDWRALAIPQSINGGRRACTATRREAHGYFVGSVSGSYYDGRPAAPESSLATRGAFSRRRLSCHRHRKCARQPHTIVSFVTRVSIYTSSTHDSSCDLVSYDISRPRRIYVQRGTAFRTLPLVLKTIHLIDNVSHQVIVVIIQTPCQKLSLAISTPNASPNQNNPHHIQETMCVSHEEPQRPPILPKTPFNSSSPSF
jgi:hypothetical protein